MNYSEFNDEQKQALLELLAMGMYADNHLALTEDARLQELLATLPLVSDHACQRLLDETIVRAGRHTITAESRRARAGELAKQFPNLELRQRVCAALEDLLGSDQRVTEAEKEFLSLVKQVFAC
ncbi:MAG: hypothetical protein IH623_09445 [Verrucomicrobia bacterium]|nr:hypothetical protein [Verrucomicrobiota bacterium]